MVIARIRWKLQRGCGMALEISLLQMYIIPVLMMIILKKSKNLILRLVDK